MLTISSGPSPITLTAHFMTSAVSSDTTRSTHLRLGSLSLRICFLTIASKARSGVKSPVLKKFRKGGIRGVRWRFVVAAERERGKGRNQGQRGKKRTARNKKKEKGEKSLFS